MIWLFRSSFPSIIRSQMGAAILVHLGMSVGTVLAHSRLAVCGMHVCRIHNTWVDWFFWQWHWICAISFSSTYLLQFSLPHILNPFFPRIFSLRAGRHWFLGIPLWAAEGLFGEGGCIREGSAALGTRLHPLHMPSKQMFPPILKPPCEKAERPKQRAKLTQGKDEIEVQLQWQWRKEIWVT